MAACGCGRSPTGQCIGWHGLNETQYQEKLREYEVKQNKEQSQELSNGSHTTSRSE